MKQTERAEHVRAIEKEMSR